MPLPSLRWLWKSLSRIALGTILPVGMAGAIPMVYTDFLAFQSALPHAVTTLDFENLESGTSIASGEAVEGIAFHYDFAGAQMLVTDAFETTSPARSLGTDDAGVFLDFEGFDLTFSPVAALGLFVITADRMFDGDITLSTSNAMVGLNVADAGTALADEGVPYFLGIIDDDAPFTSASISTIGGGFFLYNIDDIVTARAAVSVLEPGTFSLFLTASLAMLLCSRRNTLR